MQPRLVWTAGAVLLFALTAVACNSDSGSAGTSSSTPAVTGTPGAPRVDAATAGELKGTIKFEGAAPANAPIRMTADPACSRQASGDQFVETYVVGSGGELGNVFVYVKDGLGNYSYDVPSEPVLLDQQGCRYRPHVFGVMVGQRLDIKNSDPTLHNVHAIPTANAEFNTGQPIQGQVTPRTFQQKEVMVMFKCDVHGWMSAYMAVLDHPYFAVTGTDGKFDIKTLPPGTYTIEAWHEKLGTATETVTIGEKETKEISFVFKAPATT